jgi:hypothetical protein
VFYLFVGAETKGRDLEEIDQELMASAAERSAVAEKT